MPSALRALGAAALAVGQTALTVTNNGTYLATVTLDSVPVKLLVDLQTAGVWVRCSALEGPSCADGITTTTSGYTKTRLERFDKNVPRKTRRFKEVVIAGQVFNGFDGNVIYDPLPGIDTSIQGILGLRRISFDNDSASIYLDKQVTSVALQLGQTSTDSKLSLDSIDRTWLAKKGLTTAATNTTALKCFSLPLPDGSEECSFSSGSVLYDPALPYIGLFISLDTFARRYLTTCTPIGSTYKVTGYTCDASVKLPRLTMQIGAWEFFLDPSEYTVTGSDATRVKVLVGNTPYMQLGWVMGAPFLRKYPLVYNATGATTLYCAENTTCKHVRPTTMDGGGNGAADGGGFSPPIEVEIEVETKRSKKYLTIGLSVGGVSVLTILGCLFKCCKAEDAGEEEDTKTHDEYDASVEDSVPNNSVSRVKTDETSESKQAMTSSSGDDSDDDACESLEERRCETSQAPYVAASSPRIQT